MALYKLYYILLYKMQEGGTVLLDLGPLVACLFLASSQSEAEERFEP